MAAPSPPLDRLVSRLPAARPATTGPWMAGAAADGQGHLLSLTLALVSTVAFADLLFGESVVLIGLYIVGPLIAATALTPRHTVLVSVYSLALAFIFGYPHGIFGSADNIVRFATVALAGALGYWTARSRHRIAAAREHAERAERRARLLGEVGARLGATADYEAALATLPRLAVPGFADWCSVTMLDEHGSPRRLADAGDAPSSVPASDREHLVAIGEAHARSAIAAPLRVHGTTFGELAFALVGSGRRYDEADVQLVQELASRCALVIDNARSDEAARESEEPFRLLVDGVEDYAIFFIDPQGRVASWNAGAERVNGYPPEQVIGEHIRSLYAPEQVKAREPEASLRRAAQEGRHEEEGWRVRGDGSRFYANAVTTALHDDSGAMRGFARVTHDVTERKRLESQLAHQAFHDSMTSLPNRRLFLDRVEGALARHERRDGSAAVLFFDLDRFKEVNDTLGHAAGDELLLTVAMRLREAVRAEDTVARFGGDEFAVLCEDLAERGDAIMVAERIAESISAPFDIDGTAATVSASVGLAFAGARHTPDSLLQDADAAMYAAKARADQLPVVFDESIRAQSDQTETEADLLRAIEHDELRLVYQPLVDLASGEVAGVEAFVRWCHPERGMLRPADFMDLAEEPGLATRVAEWVLREACSQLARWSEEAPDSAPLTLSLAVNLSARQLPQPELPELVAAVLADTGIDPATLSLEVSDRDLVAHPRSATALFALRGLGVKLAVDDFGTGYSSLSLLKRLSVDSVKIAAPFVEGLGRRSEDSTLVAAMISMARSLGVTTVAEAVESPQQLEELRALGCDRAQGYLFARPTSAEGLEEALADSRRQLAGAVAA